MGMVCPPFFGSTSGSRVAVKSIALFLFESVPRRRFHDRTVAAALVDNAWVRDIRGVLTVHVLLDFFGFWDLVEDVALIGGRSALALVC